MYYAKVIKKYKEMLNDILTNGNEVSDRTNTGVISDYARVLRIPIKEGILPIIRPIADIKSVIAELLWIITGSCNAKDLSNIAGKELWKEISITNKDIDRFFSDNKNIDTNTFINGWVTLGSIGYMYGPVWRNAPNNGVPFKAIEPGDDIKEYIAPDMLHNIDKFLGYNAYSNEELERVRYDTIKTRISNSFDQLFYVIYTLKHNPYSKRIYISSYMPMYMPDEDESPQNNILRKKAAMQPNVILINFIVSKDDNGNDTLKLIVNMTSAEMYRSLSSNVFQYSLFLQLVAKEVNIKPSEIIFTINNAHIYMTDVVDVGKYIANDKCKKDYVDIEITSDSIFNTSLSDIKFK